MRFKIVKEIYKKEILELLRDKKNLFMMIILPILLYPMIMIGTSQVMSLTQKEIENDKINVLVSADFPEDALKGEGVFSIIRGSKDALGESEVKKKIDDGIIDVYIDKNNNSVDVFMDSTKDNFSYVRNKVLDSLSKYKDKLVSKNIERYNLDKDEVLNPININEKTVASEDEKSGSFLGRIVPIILIIGILSGSIYPAIDLIAGEKERGTLETLFTLPIKNIELIAGKYLAVATTTILTVLLNILSMMISVSYMLLSISSDNVNIEFSMPKVGFAFFIAILATIVFALAISAISMCICSFAKSYKEAQNYLTPLMLISMLPAYSSMVPGLNLDRTTSLIPIVNTTLLIKYVFSTHRDFSLMLTVVLVNIAFIGIVIAALSKIFNSEEILFGGNKGLSILNLRRNIKKNNLPTVSDGVLVFVVEFMLLIFVGGYLQVNFDYLGIALTQFMLVGFVILYSWYIKVDFKRTFRLNKIGIDKILYSILIWGVAFFFMMFVSAVMMKIVPNAEETSKMLQESLMIDNLALDIVIVAMLPAMCEELIFRGFILSSFTKKEDLLNADIKQEGVNHKIKRRKLTKSEKYAIVFSGILFGVMHIYLFKVPTTALLGMALALIVKNTNSIYGSMLGHFLNNLLAVLVSLLVSGLI